MGLRIEEFDYLLPKELIAQHPEEERASSRLLVVDKSTGDVEHRVFRDIGEYLREGDLLVLNDTRVLPARLTATKPTGGRVEILLLEERNGCTWSCLVNGVKRSIQEQTVSLGPLSATVRRNDDSWEIVFSSPSQAQQAIGEQGRMPLPPYIRRGGNGDGRDDFERYQTVYAENPGSIAAPTAGLHFSKGLLDHLGTKGIVIAHITLHIGIGTFFMVKSEHVEEHSMHREWYRIDPGVIEMVERTRREGGRVVAVGTSAVRTLESCFSKETRETTGFTDLFIYPGYRFKVVDVLVTNFHLPRSTPILLTSAFAGKEHLLAAYTIAIEKGYRFYSYGDAMLIQ